MPAPAYYPGQSMMYCWIDGGYASRAGCTCPSCVYHRAHARAHAARKRAADPAAANAYSRFLYRTNARYRTCVRRHALRRYRENRLAYQMYNQLRQLAIRDGLWPLRSRVPR